MYTHNIKSECRICGNTHLQTYLDLGNMPLANNLNNSKEESLTTHTYPLEVNFCDKCSLSQLSIVINPEILFSHYTYRSSINRGYVEHCNVMAHDLKEELGLNENSFVVDIAGNDGALLKEFKKVVNCKVLNVDPAKNICDISKKSNIECVNEFWNSDIANYILKAYGGADFITATNVFAHVDNVWDFLKGADILLKDNGILILEFPYLIDFIEKNEFDTIYFEHLSYFGIRSIDELCKKMKLSIFDIEKQKIHGGTVRIKIGKEKNVSSAYNHIVEEFIKRESLMHYDNVNKYLEWGKDVHSYIDSFSEKIKDLKSKDFKIAAFAASAKGNTLLNSAKLNFNHIDYIIDETPEKIGKFYPGTGIEIFDIDHLSLDKPDYLIILSWNFKEEIIRKLKHIYEGKFIIPIPHFEII